MPIEHISITPDETVELCKFIMDMRERISAGEGLSLEVLETTDGDRLFAYVGSVSRNISLYTGT